VYENPYNRGQIHAYRLSTGEIFILTPPTFNFHFNPDIYQEIVVWQRMNQNSDFDVIGYDLASQTPFTVSAKIGNEGIPKIYGDIVVWDWNGDIYGYNLSSSQYMTITNDPFPQSMPDI